MQFIYRCSNKKIILQAMFYAAVIMSVGCAMKLPIESSGTTYFLSEREKSSLEAKSLRGDSEASLRLAQFFTFSEHDVVEATFWYRLSAENGNLIAAHNLAHLYEEHYDDEEKAIFWYSKVIEEEPISASNRIADLLWSKGKYVESLKYYNLSASKGSTAGMERIATYNADSKYGNPDYLEAYKWALLLEKRLPANTYAAQKAKELVNRAGKELTEAEKERAVAAFKKYDKDIPIATTSIDS